MKSEKSTYNYVQEQEASKISYCKVYTGERQLVVSFASNKHDGFERKKSLIGLKFIHNDFDILYLRNAKKWYLGGLTGIGKNITHTIAFFKKEFSKYDKVICTGSSSGGYASILFGSLLNVDAVITSDPQTNLEYVQTNLDSIPPHKAHRRDRLSRSSLSARKRNCPKTWEKYANVKNVLNKCVQYFVFAKGNEGCWPNHLTDNILHGDHHYENVKDFATIHKLQVEEDHQKKLCEYLEINSYYYDSIKDSNNGIYVIGPSHLHLSNLQLIRKELDDDVLFNNCFIDGNFGLPNWSEVISKGIEKNSDKNIVWLVSDYKFNNFEYSKVRDMKKNDELFLSTQGFPYNISSKYMETHHIETLGNHTLNVIDYIIKIRPDIKLIFWCLYMRTKVSKKSSYPKHLWYDALKERYKDNIIDIDLFTDPTDYASKTIDSGGHPDKSGYKLLDEMISSAFN